MGTLSPTRLKRENEEKKRKKKQTKQKQKREQQKKNSPVHVTSGSGITNGPVILNSVIIRPFFLLNSLSPIARLTANFPITRPITTKPPTLRTLVSWEKIKKKITNTGTTLKKEEIFDIF